MLRITRITIPINHPKPLESDVSVFSSSTHVAKQQYSEFFVKVAVPLQRYPFPQTSPDISWHVSSLISKFSIGSPLGRTKMLSEIWSSCWVWFCV